MEKKDSLLKNGFQQNKPVKLIIHGFIDTGFETWVKASDMMTQFSIFFIITIIINISMLCHFQGPKCYHGQFIVKNLSI